MSEPEYTFVPGKGWVVTEGYPAFDKSGKLVLLLDRHPNNGESYINTEWHSEWVEDGKVRFDLIVKSHLKLFSYTDFRRSKWAGYNDIHHENHRIITVVPA